MTSPVKKGLGLLVIAALGGWLLLPALLERRDEHSGGDWRAAASPGPLSAAHAFLNNNCVACHTPNTGVQASSCIACHANDQALLQRQPTAFHAGLQSCVECHSEHEGVDRTQTRMDHAALARLKMRELRSRGDASAATEVANLTGWIDRHSGLDALPPGHPSVNPEETALSCVTCHANQDPHREYFGKDCVRCHTTAAWTIPEFRHPSPASVSCVQCHQAPSSHYMMHFEMVSMRVAGQEHANVSECFKCHQTTSWNDIKNVGWFKHH